jgi:hypothetical protein
MSDKVKTEPREVTIKHGLFWYHAPELAIVDGEEKEVLIEKLAFNGQTVTLTRQSDMDRGDQHGAFYSEDELKKLNLGALSTAAPEVEAEDDSVPDLDDLDDEDIVEWIMGVGMFDGKKKPTADQVVAAVGDDPDLAQRTLDAETQARGDQGPRKSVESRLQAVIDGEDEDEGE